MNHASTLLLLVCLASCSVSIGKPPAPAAAVPSAETCPQFAIDVGCAEPGHAAARRAAEAREEQVNHAPAASAAAPTSTRAPAQPVYEEESAASIEARNAAEVQRQQAQTEANSELLAREQAAEDTCRVEYQTAIAAENEKAKWKPSPPEAVGDCSTGFPTGTYKYVGTAGYVTISIDAKGCATYEAGQQRSSTSHRVIEADLGDRRIEYTKEVYCEVAGTASGKPSVKARARRISDISMCYDGLLSQKVAWSLRLSSPPQVVVTWSDGLQVGVKQSSKFPTVIHQPMSTGASDQVEMFRSLSQDARAADDAKGWCFKRDRWKSGERSFSRAHGYE